MSQAQSVACPHCNQQVINDGTLSGQVVECPRCSRQFQMPAALPLAEAVPNAGSDNPYRSPYAIDTGSPPGYGGYPSVLGRRRECSDANTALTLAIVGIFCFGIILEPIAFFLALSAQRQIARNPQLTGSGKATAALVISIINLALFALAVLVILAGGFAGQ